MPERKRLVAGNWKMNMLRADGVALAREIAERARPGGRVGIAATCSCVRLSRCSPKSARRWPAAWLRSAARTAIRSGGRIHRLRQRRDAEGCRVRLRDFGHSERRHGCGETDADIRPRRGGVARRSGCDRLRRRDRAEREAGRAVDSCAPARRLVADGADAARLIVAYEPVWAIGTGLTPTTEDIAAMHERSAPYPVRHAGFCMAARSTRKTPPRSLRSTTVDGALIGGDSLKADDFWAITQAAG